jgi:hypothetical protein
MFGPLILVGILVLLASRIVEAHRDGIVVEEALVAIPVKSPQDRNRR